MCKGINRDLIHGLVELCKEYSTVSHADFEHSLNYITQIIVTRGFKRTIIIWYNNKNNTITYKISNESWFKDRKIEDPDSLDRLIELLSGD